MQNEIYDKTYIYENYANQFSGARRHAHVQSAQGREVPNATTVVMMNDIPDGGVTISTGDFVAFFNQRYGCDRIGDMRRSIVQAQRRCELKRAKARNEALLRRSAKKKRAPEPEAVTFKKPQPRARFSFVRVALGLMLVLAIGMLFGTSALLENAEAQVEALESEVETMQATRSETTYVMESTSVDELNLCANDSVEIYTVNDDGLSTVSALLNALAALAK